MANDLGINSAKVVDLEIGADDYVTRPYSLRELLARIRAVLRRRTGGAPALEPDTLAAGLVRMDVERRHVSVDGQEITLTLKEFQLLEVMLRHAGRVLTRPRLTGVRFGDLASGLGWHRFRSGSPGVSSVEAQILLVACPIVAAGARHTECVGIAIGRVDSTG